MDVFRLHGGKIEAARAVFRAAPEPWVDLSTGISPWAYPHGEVPREAFTRLPDPEAIAELEQAAALSFGAGDARNVVAVPGTDLALRAMGRIFGGRRVAVVRPGYSGHMLAWGGARVSQIGAGDLERAALDHDVIVLANPNNPDGRIIERGRLLEVAGMLSRRDGVLIVDEAFADVRPEESVCAALDRALNVVVFRSFGKFFGLAGVRLGFVVAGASVHRPASSPLGVSAAFLAKPLPAAAEFRHAVGDWPVSGPAIALGTRAYRDTQWQALQRQRLTDTAARLDVVLTSAGLEIVGGTALYRLARCTDADTVFKRLASRGILTRPFASDPALLRVGLPAQESHWQRLTAALCHD